MKRLISLLILLPSFLIGQDIIIKKNADEIKAKVVEVGIDNIKYNKFDNLEGPIYVIPKYELFMIRYENGSKDVFKDVTQEQKKKVKKEKNLLSKLGALVEKFDAKKDISDDEIEKHNSKFYFGLFGGPNYSNIYSVGYDFESVLSNGGNGYSIGISTDFFLKDNISLSSGLYYKSVAFDSYNYYTFNTIKIPISSKFYFGNKTKFTLNSGFNIGIAFPTDYYSTKKSDFDFIFGLGVSHQLMDKLNIYLELRESLGLSNIWEPIELANGYIYNLPRSRTQAISLLVGLSYAIK